MNLERLFSFYVKDKILKGKRQGISRNGVNGIREKERESLGKREKI